MKRLLALGLAISLGGCAYRPSYSSYGYSPVRLSLRAAIGPELSELPAVAELSIAASRW